MTARRIFCFLDIIPPDPLFIYGDAGGHRTRYLRRDRPADQPFFPQRLVGRGGFEPPMYLTSRIYSPLPSPLGTSTLVHREGVEPSIMPFSILVPETSASANSAICAYMIGDASGDRTHTTAVKGRCLNHLTMAPYWCIWQDSNLHHPIPDTGSSSRRVCHFRHRYW